MKHAGGRPLKFQSVEDLQQKIDAYFESCWSQRYDRNGQPVMHKDGTPAMVLTKPYTVSGLAVFLDTSRETLMDYENSNHDIDPELEQQFSDTIKRAKQKCYAYTEEQLFIGKNPSGAIFSLKNNYNWTDKTDITSMGEKLPTPIYNGLSK